jgi:hypothetical protein
MASVGSSMYKNVFSLLILTFIFASKNLVKTLTAADKLRDLLSQLDPHDSPSSPVRSSSLKVYTNH